jgi:hypothetical protein
MPPSFSLSLQQAHFNLLTMRASAMHVGYVVAPFAIVES